MYRVETWIEPDQARGIEYFDYWNDERQEREKEWYVENGDYSRVEAYLRSSGTASDLERALHLVRELTGRPLGGTGIDLAAGNLWAVPRLLSTGSVSHLIALEYSAHRLSRQGLELLAHYGVDEARVTPVFGSFYDLKIKPRTLDFALLSAALHHADRPDRLLAEASRVLKDGGWILVIGEHTVDGFRQRCRHLAAAMAADLVPQTLQRFLFGRVLKKRRWTLGNLPVDPVLGDHEYTLAEYRQMFRQARLTVAAQFVGAVSRCRGFLLTPRRSNAGQSDGDQEPASL